MLFQRRVRYVTAWRVNAADWDGARAIADWCRGEIVDLDEYHDDPEPGVIWIPGQPEGAAPWGELGDHAQDGDWIVRLEDGTYHVMPDPLFQSLFRPAENQL